MVMLRLRRKRCLAINDLCGAVSEIGTTSATTDPCGMNTGAAAFGCQAVGAVVRNLMLNQLFTGNELYTFDKSAQSIHVL